ncbi:MAG: DUF4326 domain-containing protein [Novosphingobium sp.]|uniref:DUF4326 domain-containing protein n=1 Tax=Novosphingobium sp. NDB2Meth1 TaxID=1892847 RepID=UPI000AF68DE8|nr:DUF4326 domain-containing protein [Novosphingobium sp. NDB2Meth1]MBY0394556.1 DUF4326 domain-containing protein [Novosphingobium sp.]
MITKSVRPIRVQLSRKKGWRMPPNTVSVARPTKWGDPHDWRDWREQWPFALAHPYGCEIDRDTWCRNMAVDAFEQDIRDGEIVLPFEELRGKNLACWCKLGGHKSCHADILLELANPHTAVHHGNVDEVAA